MPFGSQRRVVWIGHRWKRQPSRMFAGAAMLWGKSRSLGNEEPGSGNAERYMMMQAAPSAPLIMAKSQPLA